ncbi:N-acetyl-gamma-glutamyl-phosphate reductase [bacterium Unc6]|nr:N-acetyl-gamma-glutamyl-phosphate reductase [bacterium Unc6]
MRIGIMGIKGYAGEKLLRILIRHPDVQVSALSSRVGEKTPISDIFPWAKGILDDLSCEDYTAERISEVADIVFLALPHRASMDIAYKILKLEKKVIDLSADFRLKNISKYEKYYEKHKYPELLKKAVYGLPEIYRKQISKADLVANPGCYPTSIILALAPIAGGEFLDKNKCIIIDSKSGVTGAGKNLKEELLFAQANENIKAYSVNSHQHTPEIEQELSYLAGSDISIVFVPHLVPMNRGILSTVYVPLKKDVDEFTLKSSYRDFYRGEPFVRIRSAPDYPETSDVFDTNFCDICVAFDKSKNLAIVISVIDNLLKGASGQAVQNMNIMLGCNEKEGLL